VIVHDLYFVGVPLCPYKAQTPLIVDAHAVLPLSLSAQNLQPISGRCSKVSQLRRAIQLPQFSTRDLSDRLETPAWYPMVKSLSLCATERPNHERMVFRYTLNVNRYILANTFGVKILHAAV